MLWVWALGYLIYWLASFMIGYTMASGTPRFWRFWTFTRRQKAKAVFDVLDRADDKRS